MSVNSPAEQDLRLLQVAGQLPLYPWSVREFGPLEVDRLIAGWSGHVGTHPPSNRRALSVMWITPEVAEVFNSSFPWGYNDGPVWAGKGLTSSVQFGVAARTGPLTVVLDPMAFRAENAAFALNPNGLSGDGRFRDGNAPGTIDLPQRFGDRPYQRIDPGQSYIRLDLKGIAVGLSTANQHWGPATEFPFILGNNAAGFAHIFLGTSTPADLWVGKLQARIEWGREDQSDWSPQTGDPRRFMSGLVTSFTPAFVPGLEIGGGRLFHIAWPDSGFDAHDFLRPLEGLLKKTVASQTGLFQGNEPDNQLASAFFRWVLPRSGFELYGEYGREDHNYDLRDLEVEPDHDASYMLGAQRVFHTTPGTISALRIELLDSRISHLAAVRNQSLPYVHGAELQGHTQLGQILGAPGGAGGGGSVVSFSRTTGARRWSVGWTRLMGCGGDGGTGACDQEALEFTGAIPHGRFVTTTGLSIINRRESLASDHRQSGLSLSGAIQMIK